MHAICIAIALWLSAFVSLTGMNYFFDTMTPTLLTAECLLLNAASVQP